MPISKAEATSAAYSRDETARQALIDQIDNTIKTKYYTGGYISVDIRKVPTHVVNEVAQIYRNGGWTVDVATGDRDPYIKLS